jgi:hypothetical protein
MADVHVIRRDVWIWPAVIGAGDEKITVCQPGAVSFKNVAFASNVGH